MEESDTEEDTGEDEDEAEENTSKASKIIWFGDTTRVALVT